QIVFINVVYKTWSTADIQLNRVGFYIEVRIFYLIVNTPVRNCPFHFFVQIKSSMGEVSNGQFRSIEDVNIIVGLVVTEYLENSSRFQIPRVQGEHKISRCISWNDFQLVRVPWQGKYNFLIGNPLAILIGQFACEYFSPELR